MSAVQEHGPTTAGAPGPRPDDGLSVHLERALDRLLADPNSDLTPLRGNRLWQLGLLEMWLQEHGA